MERVEKIAQTLYDKKADGIKILDISDLTSIGNYFIICSCNSSIHVKACAGEVEDKLKEIGITPNHIEGFSGGNWILMDYGDVIAHIFYQETRDFYGLEKLWADAHEIELDTILKTEE